MNEQIEVLQIFDIDKFQRKINKNKNIQIDVSGTKYDLIRFVSDELDWKILEKSNDVKNTWNIKWIDYYLNEEELRKMQIYQKINHFPNSESLCKKNNLAKYLNRMQKAYPTDYDFYPKTWHLPYQLEDLKQFVLKNNRIKQTLIVKPEAQCQGKGIYLIQKLEQINPMGHLIVQKYIPNPLLIDNVKFDCRLYVLIKNLNPLIVYLYKDGLARLATETYQQPNKQNLDNDFIHLTNYSIQKQSCNFQQSHFISENQEQGHKRTFSSILKEIQQRNGDINKLMLEIEESIIKCIIAAQPNMSQSYKRNRPKDENGELCFEILGFDILIDQNLKPYIIEVNHTPSFQTDSNLDHILKRNLILDTLLLLNIEEKDKKIQNKQKVQIQQADNDFYGFKRLTCQKMDEFLITSQQIWEKYSGIKTVVNNTIEKSPQINIKITKQKKVLKQNLYQTNDQYQIDQIQKNINENEKYKQLQLSQNQLQSQQKHLIKQQQYLNELKLQKDYDQQQFFIQQIQQIQNQYKLDQQVNNSLKSYSFLQTYLAQKNDYAQSKMQQSGNLTKINLQLQTKQNNDSNYKYQNQIQQKSVKKKLSQQIKDQIQLQFQKQNIKQNLFNQTQKQSRISVENIHQFNISQYGFYKSYKQKKQNLNSKIYSLFKDEFLSTKNEIDFKIMTDRLKKGQNKFYNNSQGSKKYYITQE